MLQLIVEQSSVDTAIEYIERVKQRIFEKMREGMQEAMEGLAAEAVTQASADGIQARSGAFFRGILESPSMLDNAEFIQGRVTVDDTQGRRMKHLGLWLVEGYHVPAVALANLKKNREFHRGDEFMFTASNGATVFSRSHAAFDVKERPFLHQAKEAFSSPIMQIIAARVAEAYE
jgi:hypothetical protein